MLFETWKEPKVEFRTFISAEHGLGNNLLNRYHPDIRPKNEAVLFYDDDGPFYTDTEIRTGFELWKRNSGRQIGLLGRNFEPIETMSSSSEKQQKHIDAVNVGIN